MGLARRNGEPRRFIDATFDEVVEAVAERVAVKLGATFDGAATAAMLSTRDMAAALGKHPDTLCKWARSKPDCPAIRAGERDFAWPKADTVAWLRGQRNG